MSYSLQSYANLGHVQELGKAILDKAKPNQTFKSAEVKNNTLMFYTSDDKSGTPAFTYNLSEQQLLDSDNTTVVEKFAYSSETYKGASDPDLNGKSVLVMALKASENNESVLKYIFIDLSTLIKPYTAGDSIAIDSYKISAKISSADGNAITVKGDGLYVPKTDAAVSGATEDNIATFDAGGKVKDSGRRMATDSEFREMLSDIGLATKPTSTEKTDGE